MLGLVAGSTTRIALASAVMQIPARPPALAALTAATLNWLSGGRFRLGLGVSNPDVSEGWYGVPFEQPLSRTREYVEIVRLAFRGEPVRYRGRHFRLPSGHRDEAPLHLITDGLDPQLPIYLAAVGPQNLRLTGEIGDGWLGVFTSPDMVAKAVVELDAGRARADRERRVDVVPSLPTAVAATHAEAADALRAHYLYLLGIGDRHENYYCALARELGFHDEIDTVRDLLAAGDAKAAGAAVPLALIDQTALIGPVPRLAERLQDYAAAGTTVLSVMVSAARTSLAGRQAIVRAAADALELAGVGT